MPLDHDARLQDGREAQNASADVGLSLLVVTGYAAPVLLVAALFVSRAVESLALATIGGFAIWLTLVIRVRRSIRDRGRGRYRIAAEVLVLLLLPAWGLAYTYGLAAPGCTYRACEEPLAMRPFAAPEIYPLVALHLATALAYAISRRRPEALRPRTELAVLGALVTGVVVHAALAVHLAKWVFAGIGLAPVFLPCLAPALTVALYAPELVGRLRRRGREARIAELGADTPQPLYRHNPQETPTDAPLEVHRGLFARAIGVSGALFGVYALLHAAWLGRPAGALQVLTRTCGYTLSRLPIEVLPGDCHYLCTVAARGHGWLVRPERLGRRRGVPIVVNRQLAVANAFEDLLHERWPRFGRLARRAYDRLGLPVSRYIRSRWLADVVYLAMKPFEWCFAVSLLLLDRETPERRIERMYR
jgi:hypothetical protein